MDPSPYPRVKVRNSIFVGAVELEIGSKKVGWLAHPVVDKEVGKIRCSSSTKIGLRRDRSEALVVHVLMSILTSWTVTVDDTPVGHALCQISVHNRASGSDFICLCRKDIKSNASRRGNL